ncbi:MAG: damage-control phosphatase ARMT1 family protein [Candidatus Marinarcus sp.]|uniref:damage-control phosphatase ARMT1 family protein n=1 Tax=Candidatus Marinarcus sp. TaxID=3100987 RepID=UPI003AFF913E
MNITNDCVKCIVGQIDKAIVHLNLDETKAKEIQAEVLKRSATFSFEHTPPYVARDVYEYLAEQTGLKDPLESIKQDSIQNALKHVPYIEKRIRQADDKLLTAIKASVAGNVIDFGAKEQFSLEEEINKVFHTSFAIDDYKKLAKQIEQKNSILILADNAGENVFDKILIKMITRLYPHKKITYATRGKPIINDITTKEALQIGIDQFAQVISTGVDTPGLELSRTTTTFRDIFEKAELIISKGMGNFECLESLNEKKIFFLFKVKCNVVAKTIKKEIGDIILKQG